MNIKVAAFTVREKSSNTLAEQCKSESLVVLQTLKGSICGMQYYFSNRTIPLIGQLEI